MYAIWKVQWSRVQMESWMCHAVLDNNLMCRYRCMDESGLTLISAWSNIAHPKTVPPLTEVPIDPYP